MFEAAMQKDLIRTVSVEMLSRIRRQVDQRSCRVLTRMPDDESAAEHYIKHMFTLGAAAAIYETKLQLALKGIPDDNSCVRLWMAAYRLLLQRFIGTGRFSLSREMDSFKKQIIDYYYIFARVDYEADRMEKERVALQYLYSRLSGRRVFLAREFKSHEPWLMQYIDSTMQFARALLTDYFDGNARLVPCCSC